MLIGQPVKHVAVCIFNTTLLTAILLCLKKKTSSRKKFHPAEKTAQPVDSREGKKSEDVEKTGNSKLWEAESSDDSKDSKTPMHGAQLKKARVEEESSGVKKKAEERKQKTPNKHSRKGHPAGPKPTVEKAEKHKRPEETPPADPKKLPSRPPPENVDLNDFIVKAAATNVVVDPFLVKKKGNIDDESAEPAKVKARLQRIEEEMKTVDDKSVDEDKKAVKKGVKWGDTKCVVYETRDLVTLEDDGGDDAADIY